MSAFSEAELEYLSAGRKLARLATVGADGTPHVTPTGWSYNEAEDSIEITGRNFAGSKKYRDVKASGKAAVRDRRSREHRPVETPGRRGPRTRTGA